MMSKDNSPGMEEIEELERRAELLKDMLEKRTAMRPLIIEFSGSPKAGKTRSISVIELFLKRNGIKTEVFTERASIAPIKQKGHLNFNLWVSCASLQGMLEALYRDIDVFILDRGIFDALVWNEWLEMTGKITKEEATQIAQFFTMERWTKLTDIVFVLTCDPIKSIEREYADQLTSKRGTIMSEHTLSQINQSTKKTIKKHSAKFNKIVSIDTTDMVAREGVTKIADEALKVLSAFLDESICVVPVSAVKVRLPEAGLVSDASTVLAFTETVNREKGFLPRSKAEQDPNVFQPIACAVLRYQDKVVILKRNKPGHPLHDKYDIWAGGHVSEGDNGPDILRTTLQRELSEEVFIKEAYDLSSQPIALIRTNEDARASRHIAVLYELTLKSEDVALALNQREFRSTRGTSMSGRLIDVKEIGNKYDEMGNWSRSIVDHLWPNETPSAEKKQPLFGHG